MSNGCVKTGSYIKKESTPVKAKTVCKQIRLNRAGTDMLLFPIRSVIPQDTKQRSGLRYSPLK